LQVADDPTQSFGFELAGLRDVLLEGLHVVGIVERAVAGVAAFVDDDPFFAAERAA
jgi:hypothetical protein